MDNNEVNNSSPVEELTTPTKRKFNNTVLIGMLIVIVAVICCVIVLWPRGNKEHVDSTTTVKKTNTTTTTAVGEPSSEEDDNDMGEEEEDEPKLVTKKTSKYEYEIEYGDTDEVKLFKIGGKDVKKQIEIDYHIENIEEYPDFLLIQTANYGSCSYSSKDGGHIFIFNYSGDLIFKTDKRDAYDKNTVNISKEEKKYLAQTYLTVFWKDSYSYNTTTKKLTIKYTIYGVGYDDEKVECDLEVNKNYCSATKDKNITAIEVVEYEYKNGKFINEKVKERTLLKDYTNYINSCWAPYGDDEPESSLVRIDEHKDDEDYEGLKLYGDKDYELSIEEADGEENVKYLKIRGKDVTKIIHIDSFLSDLIKYDDFLVIHWSYDNTCGPAFDTIDVLNYNGDLIYSSKDENQDIGPFYRHIDSYEYDKKTQTFNIKYSHYACLESCGCDVLSDWGSLEEYAKDNRDESFAKDECTYLGKNKLSEHYMRTLTIKNGKVTNSKISNEYYSSDVKETVNYCKNTFNITIKK